MCLYVLSSVLWCHCEFRIKTMFGSSLPPVACRRVHVLFTLFAYSGIQHILCCVFVLFVYVWCTLCCIFFWNVPFWVPLRYSLTFINQYPNRHDITEILLKVALNTKNQNLQYPKKNHSLKTCWTLWQLVKDSTGYNSYYLKVSVCELWGWFARKVEDSV